MAAQTKSGRSHRGRNVTGGAPLNPIALGARLVKNQAVKHFKAGSVSARPANRIMVLGVGSFAHSLGTALADAGAVVSTYFTRNYGHYSPTLVGKTYFRDVFPSPVPLLKENKIEVVIPQSIDWASQPWAEDLENPALAFSVRPARRCGLNANAILPANCAPDSGFHFRNHLSPQTASRRRKFWRGIRSPSSSRTRSARQPVRSTRFYAKRWPTRGHGCAT